MTDPAIIPLCGPTPTPGDCFFRTRGDDWRETQALDFQWGQLIPAVTNPDGSVTPATVKGYDITGCLPVGRILQRPKPVAAPFSRALPNTLYQPCPDFTTINGFAAITDAPNGKFAFIPDRTVTSQFAAQMFGAGADDALLFISAKLITPSGSLNTVTAVPIVVFYG